MLKQMEITLLNFPEKCAGFQNAPDLRMREGDIFLIYYLKL